MERPVGLITGATRGLGRALASRLADTHHLLIGGTDPERVETVYGQLPSAGSFVADLTDAKATAEAASGVRRLDLLVHSAGAAPVGRPDELTRGQWRELLELNVIAVADLTRLLLPALRAA